MESVESFTIWLIECRTGCTCCSDENHYRGPYRSREDAQRRIDSFLRPDSKFWPVASQYARRGRYEISHESVEPISGGRFIVDDKVHESIEFIDVSEDGAASCGDGLERFDRW